MVFALSLTNERIGKRERDTKRIIKRKEGENKKTDEKMGMSKDTVCYRAMRWRKEKEDNGWEECRTWRKYVCS